MKPRSRSGTGSARTCCWTPANSAPAISPSPGWRSRPEREQTLHSDAGSEQAYVVVRGSGTMSVAGDTQQVSEGDLILVPPATEHSLVSEGEDGFACVSIQSPPVAAAELYSDQLAEVAGYDDEDD